MFQPDFAARLPACDDHEVVENLQHAGSMPPAAQEPLNEAQQQQLVRFAAARPQHLTVSSDVLDAFNRVFGISLASITPASAGPFVPAHAQATATQRPSSPAQPRTPRYHQGRHATSTSSVVLARPPDWQQAEAIRHRSRVLAADATNHISVALHGDGQVCIDRVDGPSMPLYRPFCDEAVEPLCLCLDANILVIGDSARLWAVDANNLVDRYGNNEPLGLRIPVNRRSTQPVLSVGCGADFIASLSRDSIEVVSIISVLIRREGPDHIMTPIRPSLTEARFASLTVSRRWLCIVHEKSIFSDAPRLRNVDSGQECIVKGLKKERVSAVIGHCGDFIIGTQKGYVGWLDVGTAEFLPTKSFRVDRAVTALAASWTHLAVGGDGCVQVWPWAGGDCLSVPITGQAQSLAMSVYGQHITVVCDSGKHTIHLRWE